MRLCGKRGMERLVRESVSTGEQSTLLDCTCKRLQDAWLSGSMQEGVQAALLIGVRRGVHGRLWDVCSK